MKSQDRAEAERAHHIYVQRAKSLSLRSPCSFRR